MAHGLLVQSVDDDTFTLARSPEKISMLDILRLVRQGDLRPRAVGELGHTHTKRVRVGAVGRTTRRADLNVERRREFVVVET